MKSLLPVIAVMGLALASLLAAPVYAAAVYASTTIYKTTDSRGNPVFSDTATDGAQPVQIKKTQTFPASKFDTPTAGNRPTQHAWLPYKLLRITSPKNQTSVRSNPGNIAIHFKLDPVLRPGDALMLVLDGKSLQRIRSSGPVPLTNLDRGTHTAQLQVVDPDTGNLLQSSNAVTFTLHRHSILHKKPKI